MKVSAVSQENSDENLTRNMFIKYANSFMSAPKKVESTDEAAKNEPKAITKMGIETIQESSIFPKQVINGKTIITA